MLSVSLSFLVDKTKLFCYTPPPTQHHSFFDNLSPLIISRLSKLMFSQDIDSQRHNLSTGNSVC